MGRIVEFDHFAVGADLDIASWDSYPLGFLADRLEVSADHKRRYLRQGDPDFQAFHHDLYRAVGRGRWWVMEQQPGPVNWAPYNPDPLPGMARLWAWEAFAHGAEAVCYFRWRQPPFAQEQMHAGLLRPDNVAAPGFDEAGEVARELASMPEADVVRANVALVFDYASAWAWAIQPQGRNFDYFRLALHFYRGLRRLGLSIDMLPPDCNDLSAYRLVLAPGLMALQPAFQAALDTFNGLALVGPRTNAKTDAFAIPVPLPPNLESLDCRVARVESLPADAQVPLEKGGAFVFWRERLEGTATVLERTTDGDPAVMSAGPLRYLGGWPDDVALDRLLQQACADQQIDVEPMPEGVRRRDSATHRFYFNYGPGPADHAGVILPAAGVHRVAR
jgi:beta-galactosidase